MLVSLNYKICKANFVAFLSNTIALFQIQAWYLFFVNLFICLAASTGAVFFDKFSATLLDGFLKIILSTEVLNQSCNRVATCSPTLLPIAIPIPPNLTPTAMFFLSLCRMGILSFPKAIIPDHSMAIENS